MLKEFLIWAPTPVWASTAQSATTLFSHQQSLSKFHRPENFSSALKSFHTLEREKTPWKHRALCYSNTRQVTSKHWDVCRYPGRIRGLPSTSQLHTSLWGGAQSSAEMSLCATSSFVSKHRNCLHRKWTRGFIKWKAVCGTGWLLWLLSQDSRKELTSSISEHHTDTSEGKGRIRAHALWTKQRRVLRKPGTKPTSPMLSPMPKSNSLNTKTRQSYYLIAPIFKTIKMLSSKDRVKKARFI